MHTDYSAVHSSTRLGMEVRRFASGSVNGQAGSPIACHNVLLGLSNFWSLPDVGKSKVVRPDDPDVERPRGE
jgi:hypothetical protein